MLSLSFFVDNVAPDSRESRAADLLLGKTRGAESTDIYVTVGIIMRNLTPHPICHDKKSPSLSREYCGSENLSRR